MSVISIVIVAFSLLGALDKLFGDRFGLGKEFERAFVMFAPVALSMIGILVLAPAIGVWLKPVFDWFYAAHHGGHDESVKVAHLRIYADLLGYGHAAHVIGKQGGGDDGGIDSKGCVKPVKHRF